MDNLWILAQADSSDSSPGIVSERVTSEEETTTSQADPNTPATTRRGPFGGGAQMQFIIIGAMMVMMYLILFRGPRKKQQQHKQMMQALSRNDRVQTIGGIIGTVVDIKDDEITLKIDESNNTKMKILRSAVSRNVSKD